jgi:anti-anti-sigma factor
VTDPATVSVSTVHNIVVARFDGEIDMANADRTGRQAVTLVLDRGKGCRAAALDLTDLGYLDSSGLRMLEETRNALVAQGWPTYTIAPPGSRAERLLSLTGLIQHLATRDDLAAIRLELDSESAPGT